MVAKVFISYRRDDIAGVAGRVSDRLAQEFGSDSLFMDVDSIPLGVNFVNALDNEVAKCDVLLAVIGQDWVDARDDDGQRRLDNPHDYVRIEIAAALKRDIPVIPILVDGARIPKPDQLPDDLKDLALRNALDLRHAAFSNDMDKCPLPQGAIRNRRSIAQGASGSGATGSARAAGAVAGEPGGSLCGAACRACCDVSLRCRPPS